MDIFLSLAKSTHVVDGRVRYYVIIVSECTKVNDTKMNNIKMNALSGISIRHSNGS